MMLGPMENLRKLTKIHFLPIRDIFPSHKASTYTILEQDMMGLLTCQSSPVVKNLLANSGNKGLIPDQGRTHMPGSN